MITTFNNATLAEAYNNMHDDMNGDAEIWIHGNNGWTVTPFISSDPYSLLDMFALLGQQGETAIIMHGWAAPVDECDDLKPSQHPSRRRMRLYIHLYERELQLAIQWGDTNEIEIMPEEAQGFMAEAIQDAIDNLDI